MELNMTNVNRLIDSIVFIAALSVWAGLVPWIQTLMNFWSYSLLGVLAGLVSLLITVEAFTERGRHESNQHR